MKKKIQINKTNNNFTYLLIASVLVLSFFLTLNTWGRSVFCAVEKTKQQATTNEVAKLVDFVDRAAVLISETGEKAYPKLRTKNSEWWNGDSYLFVYDVTGKTLVLPPQPTVEGTNRWSIKDQNGVFYVREMIKQLADKDSGWVGYVYPKPGETTASSKLSYFKKVTFGNKTVLVGSGIYIK